MGLLGNKSAGTVVVDVEGDLSQFKKDVDGAAGVVEGRFGRMGKVAGAALAGGAASAIGSGLSQFADFQTGMSQVFTLLPGISGEAMGTMSDQVKDFSSEFGVLTSEVIPALGDALGSGVLQDDAFSFLETAQKLATGGATDLSTAVSGLASVTNAYGTDVLDASKASDIIFKTFGAGVGSVDEIASSVANVTPIAASMGVSFEDVGAAMAAITLKGSSMSEATTQIRGILSELGKEGTKVSDIFKQQTGKSFQEFIDDGGNLSNALHIVDDAAFESGRSLIDMFGSIEAGSGALALVGDGGEAFSGIIDQMGDSAGATDAAYATMNQGLGVTLDRIKARLSVAFINLGETLAPTVETVGTAVASFVEILSKLPGPISAGLVGVMGLAGGLLVLGGPILKAVQAAKMLGSAFSLLAANPWTIIIIAAVAAVFLIVKYWDEISAALTATWDYVSQRATVVWGSIRDFIGGVTSAIGGFFQTYLIGPLEWIGGLFESLPGKAQAGWDAIVGTISSAVATLRGLLGELADLADRALGPLDEIGGAVGKLGGGIFGSIPGFDTGGVVPGRRGQPRLILAHAGETVLPTHKTDVGVGSGGDTHISISGVTIANDLDIEQVARELNRRLLREKRAQGVAK